MSKHQIRCILDVNSRTTILRPEGVGFTIIPIAWLIRGVTVLMPEQLPVCHTDVELP